MFFLFDIVVRYIIFFMIFTLCIIAYLVEPIKHSDSRSCLGMKCNNFESTFTVTLFTIEICMMAAMTMLNPIDLVPNYWFLILRYIGYLFLFLIWKTTKIVKKEKGHLNPPPLNFLRKDFRVVIYMAIIILSVLLFFLNYGAHLVPIPEGTPRAKDLFTKLYNRFVLRSFGGYENNKLAFSLSWLYLIGLIMKVMNYYYAQSYSTDKYNLPDSWGI